MVFFKRCVGMKNLQVFIKGHMKNKKYVGFARRCIGHEIYVDFCQRVLKMNISRFLFKGCKKNEEIIGFHDGLHGR